MELFYQAGRLPELVAELGILSTVHPNEACHIPIVASQLLGRCYVSLMDAIPQMNYIIVLSYYTPEQINSIIQ